MDASCGAMDAQEALYAHGGASMHRYKGVGKETQ